MYRTIKLNKGYWGGKLPFKRGIIADPLQVFSDDVEKFSMSMKAFKIGHVTKHTEFKRHQKTQRFIKEWLHDISNPNILDIGASDGITSLELIKSLNSFAKYFVTDYNLMCTYFKRKGLFYFFNQLHDCFLIANEKFLFYPNDEWFFKLLFGNSIRKIQRLPHKELLLVNKELQNRSKIDSRIEIFTYNVFEAWNREKLDVIIVGNLLQPGYFTQEKIINGLTNNYNALKDQGILVIIHNEVTRMGETEKSTIYKKNFSENHLELVTHINGGVEINNLILSLKFES